MNFLITLQTVIPYIIGDISMYLKKFKDILFVSFFSHECGLYRPHTQTHTKKKDAILENVYKLFHRNKSFVQFFRKKNFFKRVLLNESYVEFYKAVGINYLLSPAKQSGKVHKFSLQKRSNNYQKILAIKWFCTIIGCKNIQILRNNNLSKSVKGQYTSMRRISF